MRLPTHIYIQNFMSTICRTLVVMKFCLGSKDLLISLSVFLLQAYKSTSSQLMSTAPVLTCKSLPHLWFWFWFSSTPTEVRFRTSHLQSNTAICKNNQQSTGPGDSSPHRHSNLRLPNHTHHLHLLFLGYVETCTCISYRTQHLIS